MINIRPHRVFNAIEEQAECERGFQFFIPIKSSISTLESTILISLLKMTKASRVFEFGTYRGETTRLLVENLILERPDLPPSGGVWTLDLPSTEGVFFQGDDARLASEALTYERAYLKSHAAKFVHQLLCDSMTWEPSALSIDNKSVELKFQYIFIDGNHQIDYVKKDTENSFKLLSEDTAACVIWHDYGNHQFPELTMYLDELSESFPLYHVDETMIVFFLKNLSL